MWCPGEWVILFSLCQLGRHAEICKFYDAVFRCEDVATFYISMNDCLSVEVLEAFQHLFDVNRYKCLREAAKLFVKVLKRATFNKL